LAAIRVSVSSVGTQSAGAQSTPWTRFMSLAWEQSEVWSGLVESTVWAHSLYVMYVNPHILDQTE
jgi:hypothetical protein